VQFITSFGLPGINLNKKVNDKTGTDYLLFLKVAVIGEELHAFD
jgi:hypothetical protein